MIDITDITKSYGKNRPNFEDTLRKTNENFFFGTISEI